MGYKTIFVATSGGAATGGALDLACSLAKRFQAHLEGFHAKADPTRIVIAGDPFGGMAVDPRFIDQLYDSIAAVAESARTAFETAAGRHALPVLKDSVAAKPPSAVWREKTGRVPDLVSRRARFFDLVILGASPRLADRRHSDTDEETLLHCGRPVLLAPPSPPAKVGETIAIGWNGSAAAVRAVSGALPFLATARKTCLITVGDRHEASATSLLEYLGRHGIAATHHKVPVASGPGPGEQLLATARDLEADLLVMGGYGHTPWREFLFGGATREILASSLLPVLLAH